MKRRIGFSLAGEGWGHAARVVALSAELRDRYDIVYFCPVPAEKFIRNHIPDAVIEPVPALNFVKNGHSIDYLRTLGTTIRRLATVKRDMARLAVRMRHLQLDALVSDYEPYASWAAARLNIPVLNLNHPGVILKFLTWVPDALAAQLVTLFMMPPAQKTLICSFYRGDIGPIIRRELRTATPTVGDHYLVYVKESSRRQVERALRAFPDEKFVVFPGSEGDFSEALVGCRGVIAPAGHQLLSEALYLGKPVLAIPQRGQFEQRLNARMLVLSGRGQRGTMRRLERDIEQFIRERALYPKAPRGIETFRFGDETLRAARLIDLFVRDQAISYDPKRTFYNWFLTIPEKLEGIRSFRRTA